MGWPLRARRWTVVLTLAMATLLAGAGVAGAATVPAAVTLQGRLLSVHGDDFVHHRAHFSFFLQTAHGRISLHLEGSDHQLPMGAVVRVRGTRLSDGSVDVTSRPTVIRQAAATSSAKNVAVLLLNFTNDSTQPWTPAAVNALMFSTPSSVASYF